MNTATATIQILGARRRNLERIGAAPLLERIARTHGVGEEEVLGDRIGPSVARARRELWSLLEGTFAMSSTEIGRAVGRDHTTVLLAIKTRRREMGFGA